MGRGTIERKLTNCQPIGQGKHSTPLYDLPEVASYLVKPRVDLSEYIKTMKADALPEHLREAYWSAMLKKQRWEEKAGQLWRTDMVLALFTEVLQEMRTRLQLLPDEIERACSLEPATVDVVRHLVDELQTAIHATFVEFAQTGDTPSQLGEHRRDHPEQQVERDNGDLI